jgi:hypothetical protein
LLRHHGTTTPDDVAEAMVTMVSLPPAYQYDVLSVGPTAPIGEMPPTLEAWQRAFMEVPSSGG